MDAAAKKIQLLAKHDLPKRPFHLARHIDRRFRVPPDHERRCEEREFRELQYMTLQPEADRGLLFTRPYYDMREDPPNPSAAKEAIAKTEKKKLSLSDYKNKQKKTASASPPHSATPQAQPAAKPASALRKEIAEGKPARPADKVPTSRGLEAGTPRDGKSQTSRDGDRTSSSSSRVDSKPRPSNSTNDTPEKRKRQQEDDATRPQKKLRPEPGTPQDERSRTPREDTPRKRDATHASQDRTAINSKDTKASSSSSLANGRNNMLKSSLNSQSNTPSSRARAPSVNGNRPNTNSSKDAPSKQDSSSSKSALPPLLSPLHFPVGNDDSPAKEKRRREMPDDEPPRHFKSSKTSASNNKMKSSPRIPPLLSPTLPAMIEQELAKLDQDLDKPLQRANKTKAAPDAKVPQKSRSNIKAEDDKYDPYEDYGDTNKSRAKEKQKPDRFMVTLKVPKHNIKAFKRLMALPAARKTQRSEGSEQAPPVAARKKPLGGGGGDAASESIAVKRPRTSEAAATNTASKLTAPATPLKGSTSMSRVASNNSQGNTPGDAQSATPSDRPSTRQESADPSRVRALRDRYVRFKELGSKLKHRRDALSNSTSNSRPGDKARARADHKTSIALCLESAMAYMISFRAVFDSRRHENKAQDPKTWDGIIPLLDTIRQDVGDGRHPALDALLWQLKAVILEELIKCYWSLDPATHARSIIHYERMRANTWKTVAELVDRVEESRMRPTVFGPWTTVEDAVVVGLKVIRRWAADEDVDWRAEVNVQANGA